MTTYVGNYFGHNPDLRDKSDDNALVLSDTAVGIELELEDVDGLYRTKRFLTDNNWDWSSDASLRGRSCELITSCNGLPLQGADIVTALEALCSAIAKVPAQRRPIHSARTSTHIHVDVSDMTKESLISFLMYYIMFEEILIKIEAPERISNNYCLPVFSSADLKENLSNLIQDYFEPSTLQRIVYSWPKYSAMNLKSIDVLGSIEFRVFPGSYDSKQILRWVNIILSLKKAAVINKHNPMELPQVISGKGYDYLIDDIFPADIADHIKAHIEPRDVLKGARAVQSILMEQYIKSPGIKINMEYTESKLFTKYKEGVL